MDASSDSLGAEMLVVSDVTHLNNALRRVKMLIATGVFLEYFVIHNILFWNDQYEMSSKRPIKLFFFSSIASGWTSK